MTTTPPRRRSRASALVLSGLLGVLSGPGASGARAQDAELERQQPVRIGDAALYPSLRVDYFVDDNVGLKSRDEVDASAVVLSPRLDFVADRRTLTLSASYAGEFSRSDEGALEYDDHRLGLDAGAEFDARRRASASLALERDHQDLGLEFTRGRGDDFDEPVIVNDTSFDGRFTYGASAARGNLVGGLRLGDVSYTNLSTVTDGRDYTRVEPYGQFAYRLSGATRAVLQVGFGAFDFDRDIDDRDELNVGAGISFAPTGKLRGGFLLGVSRADYADAAVETQSAFAASADIAWFVREYATISLDLSRAFDNLSPTVQSDDGERQSIRTSARLSWDHAWSERFGTSAFVRLVDVSRPCPLRQTTTGSGGVEFDLSVRRWLEFGASAALSSRGADACPGDAEGDADDLEFDRTVLGVHVRATL